MKRPKRYRPEIHSTGCARTSSPRSPVRANCAEHATHVSCPRRIPCRQTIRIFFRLYSKLSSLTRVMQRPVVRAKWIIGIRRVRIQMHVQCSARTRARVCASVHVAKVADELRLARALRVVLYVSRLNVLRPLVYCPSRCRIDFRVCRLAVFMQPMNENKPACGEEHQYFVKHFA